MAAVPADVARHVPKVSISDAMARVAHWYRVTRGGTPALGYSSRSVIGRVMDEGCLGASQAGAPRAQWLSPEVEQLDHLIARLPEDLREALLADQSPAPIKEITAKLRCMPRDFHWRRACAYGVLAGLLSAR
jgi:hypothetical protein